MKKFLLPLLLLGATPAFAQDQTNTNSNTSDSSAVAGNNVNVIAGIALNPSESKVEDSGHTWTTPNVGGSYFAGANPCLTGVGGGAAGGPFGFNINVGKNDKGCERRSDAAALHALGLSHVAVSRMCQSQDVADAFFSATGTACPGTDRSRYKLEDGSIAPYAVLPSRVLPISQPEPTRHNEPAANQRP